MNSIEVFYEGWGERWLWGTLVSTTVLTGRPVIVFEYSPAAREKGLELARYTLPLSGPSLRRDFPQHQLGPLDLSMIHYLTGGECYLWTDCSVNADSAAQELVLLNVSRTSAVMLWARCHICRHHRTSYLSRTISRLVS
jgi:hypothetical protein